LIEGIHLILKKMTNINDPNPFNNFCEGYEDFGSGGRMRQNRINAYANKMLKSDDLSNSDREKFKEMRRLSAVRSKTTHANYNPKLRELAIKIVDPRNPNEAGWVYATNGLLNARRERRKAVKSDIIPPKGGPEGGGNTNNLPPGPGGPPPPPPGISLRDGIEKEKKKKGESKIGDNYLLYRPRKYSYNWR